MSQHCQQTQVSAVIETAAVTYPQAQRRPHTEHRKSVLDAMSYPEQSLLSADGKGKHILCISLLQITHNLIFHIKRLLLDNNTSDKYLSSM